jgi:P27 family predicted phage terminase small subunit
VGRRAKTRAERLASGNAGKRPLPPELPRAKGPIDPPDWIQAGPAELAEWDRVATDLQLCGALGSTSVQLLALYCYWLGVARRHREVLEADGWTFTTTTGQIKKHPRAGMLREACEMLRKFAAELGMSPTTRGKVVAIGTPQQQELPGMPAKPQLPTPQDPHSRFFGNMGPTPTQ